MHEAKRQGKNGFRFYSEALRVQIGEAALARQDASGLE